VDLQDRVIKQGIANDTAWMGRLAADMTDPSRSPCSPIFSLCLMPYIALYVHESYTKLEASDPKLAAKVAADFKAIVARARHSLKLFEDNKRKIKGQLDYFREEIYAANYDHFIGSVHPVFQSLATDLGLFAYDSKLITTTHVATFHYGMPPRDLLSMGEQEIRDFSERYGRYARYLGAHVPASSGATFFSCLDPAKLSDTEDDVCAAEYYDRVFDGSASPDLNALLTVFRCMANFADTAIPVMGINGGVDYTEFKIRFVTVYQVLRSLQVLRDDTARTLTSRSARYLERILDAPEALAIMASPAKPFRNLVMHYGLDTRIDLAKVDLNDPLFGLAPYYYPSCKDALELATLVDQALSHTAAALNDWAAA